MEKHYSINPIETAKYIEESYHRYLLTTFPLKNKELFSAFERELNRYGKLIKGPLLEATPLFKKGKSIKELVCEGVLHKNFLLLDEHILPVERPLYLHQEIAIRKAVMNKRNLVIATGTGSGKTECFLIPILQYLFEQAGKNNKLSPGVRALLLYPMNALANDQLKRLRQILKPFPYITFGRYTGETKDEKKDAYEQFQCQFPGEEILENELLSREEMRDKPPHILLTNYAMLEYLLLRPKDCELFADNTESFWKFIVMDEAHIYNGAIGIEIAMLLRRFKDRIVKSQKGLIQCFATSATLGKGESDFHLITRFASNLFGETFEAIDYDENRQDVVEAKLLDIKERHIKPWGSGLPDMYRNFKEVIDKYRLSKDYFEDNSLLKALEDISIEYSIQEDIRKKARERMIEKNNFYQGYLYEILHGDENLIELQNLMEKGPQDPQKVAELIWGVGVNLEILLDLVNIAVQAKSDINEQPLLPARYHLFIRALEGVFICLKGEMSEDSGLKECHISLKRELTHEVNSIPYQVFELSTCRRCGQEYLVGILTRNKEGEQSSDVDNPLRFTQLSSELLYSDNGEKSYLLLSDKNIRPILDKNEDEEVESCETYDLVEPDKFYLCIACGIISKDRDEICECEKDIREIREVYKVKGQDEKNNLKRCCSCSHQSRYEEVSTRFLTGQDAPVTVLATALYQKLPPSDKEEDDVWGGGRKLLIFSDSRQDAAFFAPYLGKHYEKFLRRMLILNAFSSDNSNEAYRLEDFVEEIHKILKKKNFFPNNMGRLKEKREIYKWVIGECVSLDRQISLEGLGLLRFNLVFPRGWKEPSYFSNSPWNLKPEEIKDLYQILLGTLRLSSIIKFPDDVNPEDDYFSPRNFEFYIRGIGSDNKNHIFSWLPGKNAQNRRYDYMAKLFKKINDKEESLVREQVIKDLQNIWEKDLVHSNSLWLKEGIILRKSEGRTGVVYQLNHEFLEAVSTKISSPIKWYKCSKCGNFSSINIRSICPSYRCIGPLEEYDITEDIRKEKDHYRHLYLNLSPISMEVHEHTAQLTNQYASEIQQNFITGKLNVLSCSTTFELGVDLGELQTVLMRNVPPETANYVQRAGRAGRRADVAAFIVTYAQRRSHDLSHFNEPEKMVGGKINPPLIEISNPKIMRRHMHSQLFSHLFKINPESFGSIDRFFMKHNGIETLRNILKDRPKLLKESLLRIIPEEYHKELEIDNWSWREQLYNGETGMMDKVIDEVRDSIQEYEELEKEASQSKNYSQANLYKGIANTLKQKELLGFLGSKNILPKYGFPIDVVPLDIKHHSKESEKLDLTRDLKLAISEYAPGSEVVAGGKIWVSRGVKKMPKRDWQRFYYAVCPECGKYQESIDEEKINSCKICNSSIGKGQRGLQGLYIIPSFGFVTSSDDVPKDIKDSRPQKTYGTRIYFSEYRNDDEISEWEKEGMEHSAYSLERRFSKVGELVVVNKGLAGGFYICDYCGYAELKPGFKKNSKGKKKPDEKKLHRSPSGKNCSGYLKRVHLGHKFLSDVLELRFDGNVPSDSMFWYSLIYALLEGASLALSIKRTDIDGCLNPQGSHIAPSIILFDTVPGGAGHVKRIGKNLKGVLENALKKVQDCECDENTSCYECLRNYQNQYYHDYLKRGGVARFLEDLLVNLYEESPDTPRSIELPDFPRWLSKEVIGSSEVIIITGKLELYKPEFNYAGDTDWFDILRRASTIGSKISLVIKSIPPAISRKPDEMALLFELSRLMQKGIELYRIKDNEDVPEWHIYMKEKADNPTERVLKCRDTKKFFSAGLSQQIGSLSWLNIFNQDIIGNIKSDLQSFIKNSCIKLIPKEIFRFSEDNLIRVPEGSSYDIDHFIGKFFSNAVNDITIKDPYIHNENQHKVLGSLLNMIEKKCVNGSTVSVNIITTQPDMRKDYRGKELIEKQKVFQSDLKKKFSRLALNIKTLPSDHPEYKKLHDREIRLVKKDGSKSTVLLGRGLDFIQYKNMYGSDKISTLRTYIAVFNE